MESEAAEGPGQAVATGPEVIDARVRALEPVCRLQHSLDAPPPGFIKTALQLLFLVHQRPIEGQPSPESPLLPNRWHCVEKNTVTLKR